MPTTPTSRQAESALATEEAVPRLSIRMYRHGLGDCLLLRFAKEEGGAFNMLIDCGVVMVATNARQTMTEVAEDIRAACDGHLDVVVVTHEHWDHASGFSKDQAQAVFERMTIDEVWYGWTEDPQNELGQRLRQDRAEKVNALAAAAFAFAKTTDPAIQDRGKQLQAVLGFFGVGPAEALGADQAIGRTREAFEYLMNRRGIQTEFLYPHKPPLTLPGVPNVRVYVLGPPEDESYIKKSAPSKKNSEVYEFDSDIGFTTGLAVAFSRFGQANPAHGDDCPFDSRFRHVPSDKQHPRESHALAELMRDTWDAEGADWRRIEQDWTQAAETLALNLDSNTNNTCVVLAFEFMDTGEVFLFPGDAQVGSWLSWQNLSWEIKDGNDTRKVVVSDLLANTVFYKVGHHGSHNATLRELGLEKMTSNELVAFIPVLEADAKKNRWNNMPFQPLLDRLLYKTGGRMLRSDNPAPTTDDLSKLPATSRDAFLRRLCDNRLYFEYVFD